MKKTMKLMTALLTMILLCTCLPLAGVSAAADKQYDEASQLYYTVENGEATIVGCDYKRAGAVEIPAEMDGYPVVAIGHGAFHLCTKITSVTVPAGVTTLGPDAFNNCAALTAVSLPDSITTIGDYAFHNCKLLSSINMPAAVTEIGDRAFSNCRSITALDMPEGLVSIGSYAFNYCSNLTVVELPGCLESMDSYAFSGCSSLTTLTIAEGVTEIANGAFANCTALAEVSIPASVTTLGGDAFRDTAIANDPANWENGMLYIDGCLLDAEGDLTDVVIKDGTRLMTQSLFVNNDTVVSVTFPASLTAISRGAFSYCRALTTITLPKSVTVVEDNAFYGCSALTTVDYSGSWEDKDAMAVGSNNYALLRSEWITQEPPTTIPAPTTTTTAPTAPVVEDVTEEEIHVDLPYPTFEGLVESDADIEEDEDRAAESGIAPWLWIVIAAGAVVVIAAVVAVLVLLKKKSV